MRNVSLDRRQFFKGALCLGALLPTAGLITGCSSSNEETASSETSGSEPANSEISTSPEASVEQSPAAEETTPANAAASTLVVYFSAQGHTERVAQAIAAQLGCNAFALAPQQTYSADDLNYNNDNSRVSQEHTDANRSVALEQVTPEGFADCDTIYVGYPIWWSGAAWPIDEFIEGNDFSGKTVIPFCTSASSPLGSSAQALEKMAGSGDWQEGRRFSSGASDTEVAQWLESLSA